MKKPLIVVWFSCGAPSAVAAKIVSEIYKDSHEILICNNSVHEEHEDNLRFLQDVSDWIGLPIQNVVNSKYPIGSAEQVWVDRRYMAGPKGAPCTVEVKKEARKQFEKLHTIDSHVFGFTLEEKHRHDRFIKFERSNVLPVLIDKGLTREDCFKIIQSAGLKLPEVYSLGYPNANCIGCVKASSATYWNLVRSTHPEVFEKRAVLSRKLGARLVYYKGRRIFLDELPSDAKGNKIKSYECGILCETKI